MTDTDKFDYCPECGKHKDVGCYCHLEEPEYIRDARSNFEEGINSELRGILFKSKIKEE